MDFEKDLSQSPAGQDGPLALVRDLMDAGLTVSDLESRGLIDLDAVEIAPGQGYADAV
ncbi:MAG: hypothetical protein VW546_01905 [Gammaproteobacteria bacterium]